MKMVAVYPPALVATICYALLMLIGGVLRMRDATNVGLVGLCVVAFCAMDAQVNETGNIVFFIAAMVIALLGGLTWKELFPRMPRKERNAMAQLFPQCGWLGMLRYDERLNAWPRLKKVLQ